jgi:ribosome-associated protein
MQKMDDEKSKSQKKRDAEALQKLGVTLINWSLENLDKMPLSDSLKQAIIAAKSLKSHGAIRRQAQLIGKLMRSLEPDEVFASYDQIIADENAQTASFHEIEHWRTRLMHEGRDALTEFVSSHHPEDLQHLKQLIKKAVDEHTKNQQTGAAKALFRYIRAIIL